MGTGIRQRDRVRTIFFLLGFFKVGRRCNITFAIPCRNTGIPCQQNASRGKMDTIALVIFHQEIVDKISRARRLSRRSGVCRIIRQELPDGFQYSQLVGEVLPCTIPQIFCGKIRIQVGLLNGCWQCIINRLQGIRFCFLRVLLIDKRTV